MNVRSNFALLTCLLLGLFYRTGLGLEPTKDLNQHVLRAWTSEQGLPQDSIRALLQTRDGFLWIGTRGGLARFDGANFQTFKAGSPNSIPNELITNLAEDRNGSLWISSKGGLTVCQNGSSETLVNATDCQTTTCGASLRTTLAESGQSLGAVSCFTSMERQCVSTTHPSPDAPKM